ncbi:SGNH/GDSL hydrolase family protein [Ornithinimicrobium sp. LYQ103]|uniref:SGNH/GDSL hydrolase family protein n=1 Tax=Ornithinimicrobium sp. LYQ103 TaxID=3378796 RepID=UPI003852199A
MDVRSDPLPRRWQRYVALGDSFTEGLVDEHSERDGDYVGWADRVADALARRNEDEGLPFGYANLAIRGRRIDQVLDEQLEPALALTPDLVSLCAGGNDLLVPRSSVPRVIGRLEEAVERLRATGADVVLVTSPDVSWMPLVNRVHPRLLDYTANLWAVAQRTGAFVVDIYTMRSLRDPRMYGPDRIHLSSEGHARVAAQALWTLGLPFEVRDWLEPLEATPRLGRLESIQADREWVATHLRPWIARRLRGESSGRTRTAKRPDVGPVDLVAPPVEILVPPSGMSEIVPDTKDWTVVLTQGCAQCGFDPGYAVHLTGARLRATVPLWEEVLRRPDVAERPDPATWSPLEYACHSRDVCTVMRERLDLMLTEDGAVFDGWDQDAAAVEQRYDLQDPVTVAQDYAREAELTAAAFDAVEGEQWARTGSRGGTTTFTAATLAAYLLHDVEHHLVDVGAV